ncbi:uncharacterized protein F5891DRAFT_1129754 [Suillus fuscotomentosus]|uniref:F-box domain-containing protein n=1 Tax=Suillus fuscotomentosus TaxID=1912939 RepID=A0AAD4E3V6_9AGAM|nr:uncharacterized protein F5891DRAFT_1129754 [Suillus fuscotomentosus]KAG1897798.1 hypothetical protein F5891DRAFT_1129754 [Suillus fuscotomentosus]
MRDLPIEIINTVVQNVSSVTDLLQLRSLNKAYRELVTPIAFSKLHVKNSIQSAQNFQQIIAAANLAPYVREVVYDFRDDEFFQFPPENIEIEDMLEVADLEEALTEVFCALDRLPRLECVAANFWPTFISQSGKEIRESPFWFTSRQLTVIHSIYHAMKTSRMTSLSLNNVVMMPVSCYDFVSTLTNSPLSHLSLSVVPNADISAWSGSKEINGSLGALLPISNPTLKSLELRSPQGPYHSLETKLSSFHYPSLESLVLENTVFDQMPSPDGVEEFIIRQKSRLHHLELQSCASYVANPSVDARLWSSIWQRCAAELTSLRELVVDGDSGYVVLDAEWGYVTYKPISTTVAEGDSSSLQMFQDAIVSACKVVA